MLSPKRTKYRKHQKGSKKGVQSNTTELKFGRYGLKSLEEGRIQGKTIEAVRRTITRKLKRTGQVWIRVFPDVVVTRKPAEVRMGKGKGSPAFWVCRIQPGQILYEIDGVPDSLARQATKLAHHKLPMKNLFPADRLISSRRSCFWLCLLTCSLAYYLGTPNLALPS